MFAAGGDTGLQLWAIRNGVALTQGAVWLVAAKQQRLWVVVDGEVLVGNEPPGGLGGNGCASELGCVCGDFDHIACGRPGDSTTFVEIIS
jgi:hypothetical protein